MTPNANMLNVLGVNTAPPVGNGSNLHSLYWPRGGTLNPNTAVLDIRGDEATIDALAQDFFISCD